MPGSGEPALLNLVNAAAEIRKLSLRAIYAARSGHPGGRLSVADILAVLYFEELRVDPKEPGAESRDRFILSKGHACPALYAALALKGFFSVDELMKLRKLSGFMEGHPDVRIPGVDAPSGSLGMGLSQGLGMALGASIRGLDFRTYVVLGDGDMQEGNTWEAIMAAGAKKVDSLVAILDSNRLQGDAPVSQQLDVGDFSDRLAAFNWNTIKINGHDMDQIREAFYVAGQTKGRPTFIEASTIKGKGVSFMENELYWHGSVAMKEEEISQSLSELSN